MSHSADQGGASGRSFDPLPASLYTYGSGVLMGGADVIPGISGGTVALLVGNL